jgi:iron complex outermembrane receptor protein
VSLRLAFLFAQPSHGAAHLRATLLGSAAALAVCAVDPAAAQQSSPPSASSVTLETLEVVGDRRGGATIATAEDPRGPVAGYVATRSVSSTKTDTAIIRTPQAISVVGRQQIDDQKPASLAEATRYAPGVRGETFGADPRNDWFLIRGFTAQESGYFLDGLQLFTSAFATWKLEPFGLERLEILRGPNSGLYGGASPGGIINAVSKRPPIVPIRYVETGIDNYGNAYAGFDIGGPVDAPGTEGKLFYRLVGLGRGGGTQVDFVNNDRFFFAPSLTWKPDADTSLTVLAQVQRDRAGTQNFLPYEGTVTPAPFGFIKTSRFTGDPATDRLTRNQDMVGYEFEHRFDNDIKFRQNARHGTVTVNLSNRYGGGYATTPAAGDLARFDFFTRGAAVQSDIDNQLVIPFRTGDFGHTVLAGFEYRRYQIDDYQAFGFGPSLNLIRPIYPNTRLTLGAPYQNALITQNQFAAYLQDEITLGNFSLVLSGRHDWVATDNVDRLGVNNATRDTSAFSGRVALIYNDESGLAPYVSYAQGFNPTVGLNGVTGQLLLPERSEQTEVGLKYKPAGFDGYFAAALFDLTRSNVVTTNPLNIQQVVQTGAVNSRGAEVEMVANLAPGLRAVASYTAYDLSVTRDLNTALVGTTPTNTPEQYGSLFVDYTFQSGALRGFGLGGGVRGVGRSFADTANLFRVPGYVVGDLVAHYDWEGWRFALNVSNVSDERIVNSCSTVSACYYGERRRVLGSIGYRW